ncbi:alpha/beta fold hydrolase [Mycolicibacterium fluoranthenivorans]|uniref:Pimeloyl-ACP methyl ester carboxylesterase n=1 Tax=Mycolicibacterium fluoranthenivorans TaxID=258505 RepID=A0A7X5U1V0_9MYCO|nr:alpha/beta hydrolase [Mycolicibacterium fluoranthenivorans]MCV7359620.1 alpha/beta hydrolase [Mycolicibacterium fluoranthenivorans]NIH96848.1 pimeloyl-ACP methyl ester carboxylesterase [Mycolicibacterium fluoranthenivorans]
MQRGATRSDTSATRSQTFGATSPAAIAYGEKGSELRGSDRVRSRKTLIGPNGVALEAIIAASLRPFEHSVGSSDPAPILICLHGGGCNGRYFDIPGHSLLDVASEHGLTAVSIDRPGYGRSSSCEGDHDGIARSAEMIDGALTALWKESPAGCPGFVVVGHSIGGAIALHLAAADHEWLLLGVSVAGIGHIPPGNAGGAWAGAVPENGRIDIPREARRQLLYGPDWSMPAVPDDFFDAAMEPALITEIAEVYTSWPTEFSAIAGRIRVPILFAQPEFDALWTVRSSTCHEFGSAFTQAATVTGGIYRGVGHCIDHHRLGTAWHFEQIAFALRCWLEARR